MLPTRFQNNADGDIINQWTNSHRNLARVVHSLNKDIRDFSLNEDKIDQIYRTAEEELQLLDELAKEAKKRQEQIDKRCCGHSVKKFAVINGIVAACAIGGTILTATTPQDQPVRQWVSAAIAIVAIVGKLLHAVCFVEKQSEDHKDNAKLQQLDERGVGNARELKKFAGRLKKIYETQKKTLKTIEVTREILIQNQTNKNIGNDRTYLRALRASLHDLFSVNRNERVHAYYAINEKLLNKNDAEDEAKLLEQSLKELTDLESSTTVNEQGKVPCAKFYALLMARYNHVLKTGLIENMSNCLQYYNSLLELNPYEEFEEDSLDSDDVLLENAYDSLDDTPQSPDEKSFRVMSYNNLFSKMLHLLPEDLPLKREFSGFEPRSDLGPLVARVKDPLTVNYFNTDSNRSTASHLSNLAEEATLVRDFSEEDSVSIENLSVGSLFQTPISRKAPIEDDNDSVVSYEEGNPLPPLKQTAIVQEDRSLADEYYLFAIKATNLLRASRHPSYLITPNNWQVSPKGTRQFRALVLNRPSTPHPNKSRQKNRDLLISEAASN